IDVSTLTTGLVIAPATSGTLAFAIAHRGSRHIENFSTFADFVTALNTDLTGSTTVLGVFGDGTFDSAGGTFAAQQLLLVLSN
ncbi:MAG TPA: hypothetical protein VMH77_00200, partial [Steroidobacteraceae bacterium]|nr:hypothetical protein [Steroidobacteraceae bacterium]